MEVKGSYTFDAPPAAVWALLMDTSVIAGCIPGCHELQPAGEDRYQAVLAAPVAAITGRFDATIALQDKVPPKSYTLIVEATGRPGFARGRATMTLTPIDTGTHLVVEATADIGGTLARVGQRLLESAARMTMDRFFGCLREKIAR
jgi:carbon monoxide dehydrogenase subunit G